MIAPTYFHDGIATLYGGDCLEVLKQIADNSIDAVCTDPPYHLTSIVKRFGAENAAPTMSAVQRRFAKTGGADRKPAPDQYGRLSRGFMGKTWDGGDIAFRVELWAECWRVLKPGGHLIAFSGSRTYHRMVVAIEDAGFEVRDRIEFDHDSQSEYRLFEASLNDEQRSQFTKLFKERGVGSLSWKFGSGFPKSHDVKKAAGEAICRCASCDNSLRSLRGEENDASRMVQTGQSPDVFSAVQRNSAGGGMGEPRLQGTESEDARVFRKGSDARTGEPGLEGRRDISEASRQLREREVRAVSGGISGDGAEGRVRDGASPGNGDVGGSSSFKDGGRSPLRSQSAEQSARQSGALAGQQEPQTGGAWPLCERCGKPIIPDGWGTALKPAHEPICLARKPLSEKTVAANVLRWGVGAINEDACRVAANGEVIEPSGETVTTNCHAGYKRPGASMFNTGKPKERSGPAQPLGRHPANVVHDGSPEVVGAFPAEAGAQRPVRGDEASEPTDEIYGARGRVAGVFHGDTGSAARFFYSAKADRNDRIGSKHPTVKPVNLMRWLVRLITPPGGTVLDPFAGTGTTGHAALLEGFKAIMIEREAEYQADIARRMGLVFAGETERAHAIVKARGEEEAHYTLPLFGGA